MSPEARSTSFGRLAELPLAVEGYRLEPLSLSTGSGWRRLTTVVRLYGEGEEGLGEDVCYDVGDQRSLQRGGGGLPLVGRTTFGDFSSRLEGVDPFPAPPTRPEYRQYRRWAFESAALDLALRQNGRSLARTLGRAGRPVHFVVSLALGEPPGTARLERIRARYPRMRFKVDFAESWTHETVASLAALGGIACVDLKGHYHGSYQGPRADAAQYRSIAELLPDAWIEDPVWNERTAEALEAFRDRVTWDAVLHSLDDVARLPFEPRCINVKPSRFGSVSELLRVYEHCEARGIAMYGGGQFEIGPGRSQIQLLASLFHPDAANDVAPAAFNAREIPDDAPPGPLATAFEATGFRLRQG